MYIYISCIYLYVLVLYGAVQTALHISQFAANPPPSLHCRVASPQSPGFTRIVHGNIHGESWDNQ